MQIGEFNTDGKLEFYEVKSKARDLSMFQGAMFMDRPDLWEKPRRNSPKRVAKEQQKLF